MSETCEKMDRAQRRQRRLEARIWQGGRAGRGRGRNKLQGSEASNFKSKDQPEIFKCSQCGQDEGSSPKFRAGPAGPHTLCNACDLQWANKGNMEDRQNAAEEESTDDVTIYEGEMNLSVKDLQTQLHLSDAKGSKWQKIAAERLEKNNELQTEIEFLKLKVKEITDSKEDRHGQSETRLRAEIQSLKEKNDELSKTLDNLVNSQMEILTQALKDTKSNKQSTHTQASQGTENAGRNGHETTAEVNGCIGDQNNGHQESTKQGSKFERNGCESAAEVHIDLEQQNSGYPQRQTEHSGGHGTKIAQQVHVEGSPNTSLLKADKSVDLEKHAHDSKADVTVDIGGKHDALSGLQKEPSVGNVRPAGIPSEDVSEVVSTAAERKSALALVDHKFVMWLNSRTRRPTAEEMSFHKSQLMRRAWAPGEDAFYWTGISGSKLLGRFHADTGMEKPSCNDVTTLLRSVLHIEGTRRADDMLWCLVWADCTNPAQLPGYSRHSHTTKRARPADDEVPIRCTKVRHP